ncbi:MAG: Hg(II)-responsive transcriptional regulator [Wenzhouxiangellaceae bacterium]
MSTDSRSMTIGALARAAGVGVETVRYYQRRGLLREPERPWGGIRRYGEHDLRRLRFIRHARALGFALDEAAQLLRLDDGLDCDEAQRIAGTQLVRVEEQINRLERIRDTLTTLLQACRTQQTARCPMIAALEGDDVP